MNDLQTITREINVRIKKWWFFALIALVHLIIAGYILTKPLESYFNLSVIFSLGMLASGIMQIMFAVVNRKVLDGWGWLVALGISEMMIGVYLVDKVDSTVTALPVYVGFWMLFRAFSLIGFAFELRFLKIRKWALYPMFGIVMIVASWAVITDPASKTFSIISWTALTLFVSVIANLYMAYRLRKVSSKLVRTFECDE